MLAGRKDRRNVTGRRFKFTWSRTWPDREQDYVAADGERRIGRVYRLAGVDDRWKWGMTASSATGSVQHRHCRHA